VDLVAHLAEAWLSRTNSLSLSASPPFTSTSAFTWASASVSKSRNSFAACRLTSIICQVPIIPWDHQNDRFFGSSKS
jgi:hypothetical protein